MAVHTTRKGLELPIAGEPRQEIETADVSRRVGVVAADYIGLRPTMHVSVGDDVRRGQLLMEDKKIQGVRYTHLPKDGFLRSTEVIDGLCSRSSSNSPARSSKAARTVHDSARFRVGIRGG